jgi:hypothetical protein
MESNFGCGTLALYHLLHIYGRPADLVTIGSHLPPMPPSGYSMKELRDAAQACGVRLVGVRLKDPERELDRSTIAFLKHGHFVVVRPVGPTGKLVQVLNGIEPSEILDKDVLFRRPDWTGLVLIPSRPSVFGRLGISIASLLGLGMLLRLLVKRKVGAGTAI